MPIVAPAGFADLGRVLRRRGCGFGRCYPPGV
ncbi:MAG: hypothetical protein E7033_06530 [Akkermansiaceae bacterium]|nr:hypothetical protein [Akkermansiaceae bacterium]